MAVKPTYEELEQRVKELEKGPDIKARFGDRLQILSLAIAQSSEGIAVSDLNGKLEYLNDAFAQMHGYSAEELIGENLSIFHTLHQMPSVEEANQAIKETGEFKGEIWHKKRDGTIFPTMMHNSIVRDNSGKPVGMMGTLRDISDIKQAEEALQESEERFRLAFENANEGVCFVDTDGNLVRVNNRMCDIFGYSKKELESMTVNDIAHPEDRDISPNFIEKSISGEVESAVFEKRYFHRQGNIIWGRVSSSIIKDAKGDPLYFISHVQDITQGKQIEEKLRENEQKYRQLFDHAPAGIYEVDFIKQRFVNVNDVICEYTGYTREELLSMGPFDILTEESKRIFTERIWRLFAGETIPETAEFKVRGKDGKEFWVLLNSVFLYENGKPKGATVVVHDITARKQADEALRESEEKYRQLFATESDAIMIFDAETRDFLDVNNAALDLYGYTREEFLKLNHFDITAEQEASDSSIKLALEGKLNKIPLRYHKKTDGTIFPVEISASSFTLKNRKVIYGVIRDITKRRQTEEALRESELWMQSIFNSLEEGVFVVTPDRKWVNINKSAQSMFGYSKDELVNRSTEVLHVDHEHYVEFGRRIKEAFDRGEAANFEFEVKRKNGDVFASEHTVSLLVNNVGEPIGIVSVVRDLTDRKKAEVALQKAHDQLEHEVQERTSELSETNERLREEIRDRKKAEEILKQREKDLEEKGIRLQELNAALKILLEKRDADRRELEEKVMVNVKEMVLPYVAKLKDTGLGARQETFTDIIESNLDAIISPFLRRLSSKYLNLTPTELKVADLVKQGLSTKEIGDLLNSSPETISRHRKGIRKKLQLKDKKSNLRTHLLSLQ